LAQGHLAGIQYGTRFSAHDCFELGRQNYNVNDHDHSDQWMAQALHILDNEEVNAPTVDRTDVLEYMAFSAYLRGNMRRALELTNQLLTIMPNHPKAAGNVKYYERALAAEKAALRKKGEDGSFYTNMGHQATVVKQKSNKEKQTSNEQKSCEKLCRGEVWMDEA